MNKNRKLFKIFAPFVLICGGVTLMTSCNEPDVEPEVHFVKQFSELKPYDCITSFTFNISGDPYNPEADTITNIVLGETENFSTYDTPENTYITLELHTSYIVQTIMFYQVSDGIVLANESFTITNYFT
jgi:ABC-type oligopeptide transport system substrate-binding subunit